MKKIDSFKTGIVVIFAISFFGIIYGIYSVCNASNDPNIAQEGYQKTLEYVGFDGKKHQCIVVNTGTHNWVLVEKR